jgi:hypothetical protein
MTDERPTGVTITPAPVESTATVFAPTVRVHGKPPEDHPLYGLVGRFVVEFAHLEHSIDVIIWDVIGGGQADAALKTRDLVGATKRIDMLIKLASKRGTDAAVIADLRALNATVLPLQRARNRIVHDPWYIDQTTQAPGQFRGMPTNEPHFGIKDIDEAYLRDQIALSRDLRDAAAKFWNRILAPQRGMI